MPGEFHEQTAWWATVDKVTKVSDTAERLTLWTSLVAQTVKCLPTMWETQVQSLGQEDPLEKEMATHSSILACEILWTEEPGGLWSMGSQKSRMQLSKQQQPCLQDWLHNFWALRKMQTQSPLPQDY